MPGAAPGTQYYGILDGTLTTAILVTVPTEDVPVYLLAVPPPSPEYPRIQQVRDPQHPLDAPLQVVLHAVERLNGMRRHAPGSGPPPLSWGEGRSPRLDDLVALTQVPAALPIDAAARRIAVVEAEDADHEDPEHESNLELVNLAARLFPAPGPSATAPAASPSEQAPLGKLTEALEKLVDVHTASRREQLGILDRLTALEQGGTARAGLPGDRGTGVFSTSTPASALTGDDHAFLSGMLRLRPTVPPTAPPTSAPVGGSTERQVLPTEPAVDGPSAAMLQRATAALEVLAGTGESTRVAMPKTLGGQLFKLDGARGRVAQDLLNAEFERDPSQVVREFEEAVARLKRPEEPGVLLPAQSLVDAWREHVPAREHALVVRVSEAVLSAYCAFRANQVPKGMARLALLLAALEQHTLDGGKWAHRAETLLGLPPAPMHLYHAPSAETKPKADGKDGKQLGPLAQFCSPQRATTALAVFKENHP